MHKKLRGRVRMFFLCSGFIGSFLTGNAQVFTQQLRGKVFDELSRRAIAQAQVILSVEGDSQGLMKILTDKQGNFQFDSVRTGRYTLNISHEEYRSYRIPDVLVHAGKIQTLEIGLQFVSFESDEVEISGYNSRKEGLSGVSTRVFTVEESQRYAATYYDPARLASYYPGIAVSNDQSNNLVIRGNSPNGVLWRLEGVDIVNPNHLTNAGTFSNRLSQSGGGTIILSNQLLTDSRIQTSAFDPEYGNALAGVFDMRLRKGNVLRNEFVIQPSLIGLDLSAEGPLSKGGKGSYLVNYRYSTVGLFDLIGLEITPEKITYQDLAFNLNLPTEKAGTFTLFGMGGLSSDRFEAPREDSLITENRDRFDIEFYSNMGALGVTHSINIGDRTLWKSVLAASAIESEKEENFVRTLTETDPSIFDRLTQQKLSFNTRLSHRISPRLDVEEGVFLTRIGYDMQNLQYKLESPSLPPTSLAEASGNSVLIQPFVSASWKASSKLSLKLGLHGMHFTLNGSNSVEPRLNLDYRITSRSRLTLAYGLHSQLQLLGTYFANFEGQSPNRELGFTKSHHAVLRFVQQFDRGLSLTVEPYYQKLFNVPISPSRGTFSALNLFEGYVEDTLLNEGSGQNYGLEISLDQELNGGLYYMLSGSFYEATYTGSDGIERDTRFNGQYLFNAVGGKEFERTTRKGKNKTFGINISVTYQGGFRVSPIDIAASQLAQRTIFDENQPFSEQLPAFFRTDLRFVFKRNKQNFTRIFSVDILNVSNRQNVSFRTYDIVSQEVVDKTGLGLLPLLSYRLEF